jgi:hypothetical protein
MQTYDPAGSIIASTSGDVGQNVNNAFTSAGGSSSHVLASAIVLIPPGTYTYSVPIQIPHNTSAPWIVAPILDCQGSTLNYAGTGDAVIVHGENVIGPGNSGSLRNCTIQTAIFHNPSVSSLLHIKGRMGFILRNITLNNATICIDWENTNTDGGPGYQEQNIFDQIASFGCATHLLAHSGAGATPSFEYNTIHNWHFQLDNGENGLNLASGGTTAFDMQGAMYDMLANTFGSSKGATANLIYIGAGNSIFRGNVNLRGENTGGIPANSVQVNGGRFYNTGNNILADMGVSVINGGTYVLHPPLSPIVTDLESDTTVHYEPESGAGGAPGRVCKYDLGMSARFWLASLGGVENDCEFQIIHRSTDSINNDVYHQGNSSHPPTNSFYVYPVTGNIGVGPGYGSHASIGTNTPTHTLEVNGSFSTTTLSIASVASLTTTAATTDVVTVTGATSSSHCFLTPANSTAAANLTTTFISAKATNAITVTHTATAGMTYDLACTAN